MKAAEKTATRFDATRVRALKRTTISLTFALALTALALCNPASAQVVSQAQTSAGPALTTYVDTPILAWAGVSGQSADGQTIHKLAYKINNGAWEAQQFLPYPAINTTAGPALATVGTPVEGDLSETAYMAWRQDDGFIHYAVWDYLTNTFSDDDPSVCDGTICEAATSPALAGSNTTLYAAWTTAAGKIQYASYEDSSWTVYTADVPNVSTTIAPALAVYDNSLFLAWVDQTNHIHIENAALPLPATGGTWISQPAPSATTSVAPALGIGFYVSEPWKTNGYDLFVAWNTGSVIELADWATTAWNPFPGPVPPGPLVNYSPAMNTYTQPISCGTNYWYNLAFTLGGSDATEVDWTPVNGATDVPPFCAKLP
jgi:hypothetical protein